MTAQRDAVDVEADAGDLIAEAIEEAFGTRCPDFEPDCHCCRAWAQYEALLSASNSGAEATKAAAVANLKKWLDRNHASLHAGEFSAQEWRTLRSVIGALVLETAALPLPAPGAPASPWRPIEEAPKDGTRLLLCWAEADGLSEHVELGRWRGGWGNTYDRPFIGDPDYFMPLPTPPASKDT